MKIAMIAAAAALALASGSASAISDNIRSDRESECAIWLCLPGGFAQGCSAAKKAYLERIHDVSKHGTRKYTDLPAFKYCKDENPEGIKDTYLEPESVLDYHGKYEVHMPEINTCTRWKDVTTAPGVTKRYCAAVSTTPAEVFDSDEEHHPYKTIKVGAERYTEGEAPVRHYAYVLVDGQIVGEKYYDSQEAAVPGED